MSRKPRNLEQEMVYHVVCKGNNREFVLRHDIDKAMFLETVKRYRLRYDFEIYAFCIMDNHVHMLIKMGRTLLSKVMQGISQSFTQKFNRKYDRSGHVFEGRYFASPCPTQFSIMKAMAYIHLNPFKAGICQTLNYLWSSHYAYAARGRKVWFDSLALLRRLRQNIKGAKAAYRLHLDQFMNDPVYFEYHETDVVQEPMTLDELLRKLKVNRRYDAVDHLLRKAFELMVTGSTVDRQDLVDIEGSCGSKGRSATFSQMFFADGRKNTNSIINVIALMNQKLKLISSAELARRLKVKRYWMQRNLRAAKFMDQVMRSDPETRLQMEVQAYLNFEQNKETSEEQHLRNLEALFFDTLRIVHVI